MSPKNKFSVLLCCHLPRFSICFWTLLFFPGKRSQIIFPPNKPLIMKFSKHMEQAWCLASGHPASSSILAAPKRPKCVRLFLNAHVRIIVTRTHSLSCFPPSQKHLFWQFPAWFLNKKQTLIDQCLNLNHEQEKRGRTWTFRRNTKTASFLLQSVCIVYDKRRGGVINSTAYKLVWQKPTNFFNPHFCTFFCCCQHEFLRGFLRGISASLWSPNDLRNIYAAKTCPADFRTPNFYIASFHLDISGFCLHLHPHVTYHAHSQGKAEEAEGIPGGARGAPGLRCRPCPRVHPTPHIYSWKLWCLYVGFTWNQSSINSHYLLKIGDIFVRDVNIHSENVYLEIFFHTNWMQMTLQLSWFLYKYFKSICWRWRVYMVAEVG